jgi:hypothetical protein
MEKTIDIKNNDFKNYMNEFKEDTSLSLSNIREKSLMVSSMRAKWLGYYMAEKENLQRIQKTKANLLAKKVETGSSVLRLKNEDSLLQNDETMKKLNTLQDITKENLDFLERAMNIMADFGFSIKNTVEILKLQQ